jgi:hypothetical protein
MAKLSGSRMPLGEGLIYPIVECAFDERNVAAQSR